MKSNNISCMKSSKWVRSILLVYLGMSISFTGIAQTKDYSIKGYFTSISAREHVSDMPREFHLLIQEDGTITSISFERYSNNNKGVITSYSIHYTKLYEVMNI